jgi:hypothetical protein
MGIQYDWTDRDQGIVLFTIESPWTWDEYREVADSAFGVISKIRNPIATIVDVRRVGKLPPGRPLEELKRIEAQMPENVFASVVVGAPYIVMSFMNILMQMRPRANSVALFAGSIAEAQALIEKRYGELPEKPRVKHIVL